MSIDVNAAVTALEEAMAKGRRRVKIGDQEVEYHGPAEMLKALAYFRTQAGRGPGVVIARFQRD